MKTEKQSEDTTIVLVCDTKRSPSIFFEKRKNGQTVAATSSDHFFHSYPAYTAKDLDDLLNRLQTSIESDVAAIREAFDRAKRQAELKQVLAELSPNEMLSTPGRYDKDPHVIRVGDLQELLASRTDESAK